MATDSLVDARRKILDPSVLYVNRSIADLERVYNLKQRKEFGPYFPSGSANYFTTPDSVANSITGTDDLDVRVKLVTPSLATGTIQGLITKRNLDGSQGAWGLRLSASGPRLDYALWDSVGGIRNAAANANLPASIKANEPWWARMVIDVDDGAAGTGVLLYYGTDGVNWTQEGTTLTTAGALTGGLFDGTAPVAIGTGVTGQEFNGKILYAELRKGINGPVVAVFDPSTANPTGSRTPTTLVASTGETWTANGSGWYWIDAA